MAIDNQTAADGLINLLVAQGVTLSNATTAKASLKTIYDAWNATISPVALANRMVAWADLVSARDSDISDWALGTPTGGPTSNGLYSITIQGGGTVTLPCPAKMIADMSGFQLQGSVATSAALPLTGNATGYTYLVLSNSHLWAWTSAGAWLDLGPAGAQGATGPSVDLRSSGGFLQYRAVGSPGAWTNIVAMSTLVGDTGPAIEQQVSGGYIQWRVVGAPTWTNLIAISALTGADSTVPGPAAWKSPVPFASGIVAVVGPPATLTVYLGETYVCTTSHTTTGTFVSGNWQKVSAKGSDGAGFGDVVSTNYGSEYVGNRAQFKTNLQLTSGVNIMGYSAQLQSAANLVWSTGRQVLTLTAANTITAVPIGAVNSTDILDRAAGDVRYTLSSTKGVANGLASLGSDGKLTTAQIPDSILGNVVFQGLWNASTNSPGIPTAASGNKGWYYIVSVTGTTTIGGINDWQVGDWVISDGTAWRKVDNTDAIASVAGLTGSITKVALNNALAGVAPLDLVRLDSAGKLPAIDGSQLTNLPSSSAGTFVASGAITNRYVVALRSDGKVEVISTTGTTHSEGTPVAVGSINASFTPQVVYNSTSGKLVALYGAGPPRLKMRVGTVSGNTISWGIEFDTGFDVIGDELRMISLSGASKVCFLYHPNTTNLAACIAVISGTTIASTGGGYVVSLSTRASGYIDLVEHVASAAIVVGYVKSGLAGALVAFKYSGSTITAPGVEYAFPSSGTPYDIALVYDAANTKVICAYRDNADAKPKAFSMTVTAGPPPVIAVGTLTTINAVSCSSVAIGVDTTAGKILVFAKQANGSLYVGTVSGTTLTWSTTGVQLDLGANSAVQIINDTNNGGCVVYWAAQNAAPTPYYGRNALVKITGGLPVVGAVTTYRPASMTYSTVALDTVNHKYVSLDDSGNALVTVPDTQVSNIATWLGWAQSTVADAANVTVSLVDQVVTGLSGLTPLTTYYMQANGTLGTTDAGYGKAGKALSATSLLQQSYGISITN